jgi:hypothetical protein
LDRHHQYSSEVIPTTLLLYLCLDTKGVDDPFLYGHGLDEPLPSGLEVRVAMTASSIPRKISLLKLGSVTVATKDATSICSGYL